MVNAKLLLADLKLLVKLLEDDIRDRAVTLSEIGDRLNTEYQSAKEADRTGEPFEAWREEVLTQAAVAWILGCVFVRFMEDNGLIDAPLISGPGDKRHRASDGQTLYFRSHPTDTDRDYLYHVFSSVAGLPAVAKLYDKRYNSLWAYGISGDAAKELIAFWRQVVPETGELVHDFTDAQWSTRFLGDLYQDLSESARKRYALLQTPVFVEQFILDRTLTPAIDEFGLGQVRLIDPSCGSGHFLLGAFQRLLDQWFRKKPGTPERVLVQRALDGVYGVDVNPYASAIARFRLVVEALKASGIRKVKEAPSYRINITAGDSLLHGPRFLTTADSIGQHTERSSELEIGSGAEQLRSKPGIGHAFEAEDYDELNRILGQRYHVVVGNPPYITVKDRALNQLYRDRYKTCYRKYAFAVPFAERFFQLAMNASSNEMGGGYVGMITANSFMKREFGKKLVERFISKVDLTHVIDTAGCYIPGHGTPTVILLGREQSPIVPTVRTVMGIKGEPSTPTDAARGIVWSAIVQQIDQVGSESEWVSVVDAPRESFANHPWSIGGGGAAELKEVVEQNTSSVVSDFSVSIGPGAILGEDEAFGVPVESVRVTRLPRQNRPLVEGNLVRDWALESCTTVIFPYDEEVSVVNSSEVMRWLWRKRTILWNRATFGKETYKDAGRPFFEYHQIPKDRNRTPLAVAFADIATHNHFVLNLGIKIFNRTAPIITLPSGCSEKNHLALIALLNSSVACFWLKQVCFPKGGDHVGQEGARVRKTLWDERYAFNATNVAKFPISEHKPVDIATELHRLAWERQAHLPSQLSVEFPLSRADLNSQRAIAERILAQMVALQEELDWSCYELYGIIDQKLYFDCPPDITLGQRAFEIAMARKMAKGELETTWFQRHRTAPITELPNHWPTDYRQLVERRIALIESDRYIGFIERPEYKRRWNVEPWDEQEKQALKDWLLNRLEQEEYWPESRLQSARSLAAQADIDAAFLQVAELYVGHAGFDTTSLVAQLVESESVPFLPVMRYKSSGLRKRKIWEKTWQLQRQEDAIEILVAAELTRSAGETVEEYQERIQSEQRRRKKSEVGDIASPPKYRSTDFTTKGYWRLRGPLDVPKERFVSYLHCSREIDPSLVVGWAGWDHLQQAQALIVYYTEMVEQEGWQAERLRPMLAGLAELLPWLKQWHNDIDPMYNERMGDFFETFLRSELQKHSLTREDLATWKPPGAARRRGRRRRA